MQRGEEEDEEERKREKKEKKKKKKKKEKEEKRKKRKELTKEFRNDDKFHFRLIPPRILRFKIYENIPSALPRALHQQVVSLKISAILIYYLTRKITVIISFSYVQHVLLASPSFSNKIILKRGLFL
jgi:ATP-dependent protease Clp ATPase subunit